MNIGFYHFNDSTDKKKQIVRNYSRTHTKSAVFPSDHNLCAFKGWTDGRKSERFQVYNFKKENVLDKYYYLLFYSNTIRHSSYSTCLHFIHNPWPIWHIALKWQRIVHSTLRWHVYNHTCIHPRTPTHTQHTHPHIDCSLIKVCSLLIAWYNVRAVHF